MYSISCKICGEIFKSEFKGREKGNLVKHIKAKHSEITIKDYYVKYYCNGVVPLCACGCGKETEYYKFSFFKYLSDHKNYVEVSENIKTKISNGLKEKNILENRLKRLNIDEDKLYDFLNKYKTEKYSLNDISNEISIDKRTITKLWIELKLITKKELEILRNKTKYLGFVKNRENLKISDEDLQHILLYMEYNKGKFTLNQLRNELNLKYSTRYIMKKLKEKYGDGVLSHFKLGGYSNVEIDFFNVLRFYFGNNIQLSFKLEEKYFDYKLGKKLLIELDGTYWHSTSESKENDKYKNELALKHGYQILRINDKNVKDLETIIKIKKIYEKIQTC